MQDRKKYLNIYLAFAITIGLIILIGTLINIWVPNIKDEAYIKEKYIQASEDFVIEKSERMQYIALTILFPIIYVISYICLNKLNIEIKQYKKTIIFLEILSILIIIGLIVWITVYNKYKVTKKETIKIIFSITMCAILITIYNLAGKKNTIIKWITYILTAIIIGVISYLYINPTFEQLPYLSYHVDAYYYPIQKILNGLTPYINFVPIYGCYSYVYVFLQGIINNESILCFSIINAILVLITLINLWIVTNKTIKNKVVSFITYTAITFGLIIYTFVTCRAPYLQYMPHRVLFPSMILLCASMYLRYENKKNKVIMQIIGFIIASIAMFWNFETGLVVLISWIAFLMYEILFFESLKDKKTYINAIKIISMAILSIIATYLLIAIITYVRTKEFVKISTILASQLTFYKDGFYMLRMYMGDPWMLVIYVYSIGLAVTLRKLFFMGETRKVLFKKNSMIFLLSILGIGVFSYYQGRSHPDVLMGVTYPAVILLGIFADVLLKRIVYSKHKVLKILNIIMATVIITILSQLSMKTITEIITNKKIHEYMNKEKLNSKSILADFSKYDTSNMEFITLYESQYYKKYKLKNEKEFPAFVDIFTNEDCEKIINYIDETNKDIVIEKKFYKILKDKFGEEHFEKFNIKEYERNIILLEKEREAN